MRRLPQPPDRPAGGYEITLICPICRHLQREWWPGLKAPTVNIKCDGCGHLVAEAAWRLLHYRYHSPPPGG